MFRLTKLSRQAASTALVAAVTISTGSAVAMSSTVVAPTATPTPAATPARTPSDPTVATQLQQQHLALIQSRGGAEITRRLVQLDKLKGLITAATKVTAADRTTLTAEVATEVSGLTSLQQQLDAETVVAAAAADAQSIFSEYRVYALVTPKIHLIKVADDQQVNEAKLALLATKLQDRLATAQKTGKDVAVLQGSLTDMNSQVKAAQAVSSSIESTVIGLQPSDYNANHSVLSGDGEKLQAAHQDNLAAYKDAQAVVKGLKQL